LSAESPTSQRLRLARTDLETLRELIHAADRARDDLEHEQFLRDDHEVHKFLVHMIKNPLLQDAADRLLLHSVRFWRLYWSSRPANLESMLSHSDLLAALESKDPELAEKAMREHLRTSRHMVQRLF